MKIKMLEQITGTRDGVRWPAVGEEIDLPDHEAAKLCAAGRAKPVETRRASVETATSKPAVESRGPKK